MTLYLNAFLKTGELSLFSNSSVIQSSETAELSAYLSRNGNVAGETVYFYEKYEPTLNLTANKSIMQTGETLDLKAKLKDEDGSLVKDETVYFFKELDWKTLIDDPTEYNLNTIGLKTLFEVSNLPNRWELSCDFKTNCESRFVIGAKDSFTGGNPQNTLIVGSYNGSKAYYGYRDTSTHTTDLQTSVTSYIPMKIRFNNGNVEFTVGENTYTINNIRIFNNVTDFVIGMVSWGNNNVYVKNVKLTILEE